MTLASTVRILGRGQGRARSLTQQEAFDAMALMLTGTAEPEAVGAVLMLMRMKGEVAEEIAGFVQAAQAALYQETGATDPIADLDWSAYAAGRTRGSAWVPPFRESCGRPRPPRFAPWLERHRHGHSRRCRRAGHSGLRKPD